MTYLELEWIRKPGKTSNERLGLTNDQKHLVELVLFRGVRNIEEIAGYLCKRKDNLNKRVIRPVIEMGLLETDGETLTVPDDFEAVLRTIFVKSGGKEALEAARQKFERDRTEFRQKGEQADVAEQVRWLRSIGKEVVGGALPGELEERRLR